MWSVPVLSGGFAGAAQFASNSGIELTTRIPNIFGHAGDYVDFYLFQSSASAWTILGSTIAPDSIVVNNDTVTLTNETSSDSITLAASLSTTEWNHIRLIRSGNEIQCWTALGDAALELEGSTLSVVPLTLGSIGKNASAYTHVNALKLTASEEDYLQKATPAASLQGHEDGFWISGRFRLDAAGDFTIADCMNGNNGWKVEVVEKYFSKHALKFTVGNGTTTQFVESTDLCHPKEWIPWVVQLEKLVSDPDAGDTTIAGFTTETGNFYYGCDRGTSQFAGGLHAAFCGGVGTISTTDEDWLLDGKVYDDFSVSSQITLSELSFAYGFTESTGDRVDLVGAEDLSEVPGYIYSTTKSNGGFETLDGTGGFANWTEYSSGTSSVNIESVEQYAGTYCVRLDIDGSSSAAYVRKFNAPLVIGKEYDARVYAKTTGSLGSFQFTFLISGTNNDITFTSNDWTQYTFTFTATTATGVLDLKPKASTGANRSLYFDNLEVQATEIGNDDGPDRGNVNSAAFTGYLRNLKILSGEFSTEYVLDTDATDIGGDANDGTATNITWAVVDPAA